MKWLSDDQYVLVQWSKAVTADGRTYIIETITDVSERKRMEEAEATNASSGSTAAAFESGNGTTCGGG